MYFKQFYLGCLAHASYLIGSEGEAAVVDPQRDVEQYLEEARARGFQIKYVIETHLHADFVSGHNELAERTGARIVLGKNAGAGFEHQGVGDGDVLRIGHVRLDVIETPGHTPEGISVLVTDSSDTSEPSKLLTGDTLFIGDVGRPDLAGSKGFTAEAMAGMLYDSLHEKILRLDDGVEVYPAHGAGSLCGRNMSSETMSTIGEQKRTNPALRPMEKAAFIKAMTTGLPEVPAYFARDVEINREGAPPREALPDVVAIPAQRVRELQESGHMVLDVRNAWAFGTGHVPGSVHLGLEGQFASWAGSLIALDTPIVLVADDEVSVTEAVTRLSRVGFESVRGYLEGGIYGWHQAGLPVAETPQISVDELRSQIDEGSAVRILDVRRPAEYATGHVPGAVNMPLDRLSDLGSAVEANGPTVVLCASGYRSSAAASLLERQGLKDVSNVVGGTAAWVEAEYPVTTESGAHA